MTEMKEYSQMTESHRGGGVFQPCDISNDQKEKDFATSDDQIRHGRRGVDHSVRSRTKYFSRRENSWITTLLVGLIIMGSLPPGISPAELSETVCKYFNYKAKCLEDLEESWKHANVSEDTHCIGEFDGSICWPHTGSGLIADVDCPDYLWGPNDSKAYRFCSLNASWHKDVADIPWKFTESCRERDDNLTEVDGTTEALLDNLQIMYTICLVISLTCLVIALLLLAFFKKLHCTRNYIHMNLMVSFILKYVIILVRDRVIDTYYDLSGAAGIGGEMDFEVLRQYCDDGPSTGWILTRCRLVVTLMHYTVTANYFWLLVEGLYLQMLLVFVMAENKYFAGFMVFGWGAPWISVLIWVVLRINFENEGCWQTNDNLQVWWTIRAPIMISIVLNFIMFINIIRMIVSKLKANNMARTDKKLRLAKSTLALIPLLGIHYMVFLVITDEVMEQNKPSMHLKLAFELFFNSIQGTLISILYCFLNHEVRAEVRRAWKLWRSHQNLPRGGSTFRKSSTVGSANNSTQVTVTYSSRHSATACDIPLLEQTRTSSHSDYDSKENPANHVKVNGDCISINQRNGFKIHNKMDGLVTDTVTVTQPVNGNGHIGNGDIHVSSADEPFLLKET